MNWNIIIIFISLLLIEELLWGWGERTKCLKVFLGHLFRHTLTLLNYFKK